MNLSEIVLITHIPLQMTVFGKERLINVLDAFQRGVNKFNLMICFENVLKTSWQDVLETFLQNVLKTS